MLEFEHLTFSFDRQVIFQDMQLALPQNTYGLIGRNGSGKSTLVKLLLGELHPSQGRILFDGKPLMPSCISYIPESLSFGLDIRVQEFLRYMAGIRGLSLKCMLQIAEQLHFDAFRSPMRDLSYGMLQKLNWIQGLAKEQARILIMDEATVGLDDGARNQVLAYFKTHFADRHAFMISHRLDDLLTTSTAYLALQNHTLHPIDIFKYVDVHLKEQHGNAIVTTTRPYHQRGDIDPQRLLGMENSIDYERLYGDQHG
ncbi:ATP-binding cassette domain-containing protein [Deinococcus cellulosilyticus]|uniref:ABC transporter domain-containing protein n=1 Tax=Deinococcus cellulosilyticus (strain DSM 18568 / NBRC 106333 / KACC 11606 / 5516J-15) TaxID=1223518 RepID=A0A511N2B0_DEIC1|nr:ABC transporter ATP-binding protein [Deinococcus cellulosilyticus]GEM46598.1 hypothetical protein DC3_22330 [Deinococcus cellulosilyticus NBRC 106333 = KACC 11606]